MKTDWRDTLVSLMGSLPEGADTEAVPQPDRKPGVGKLAVQLERKGRGGKTATIIYGFTCGTDELQRIASELKHHLGTGGSARGGEILVQGDRVQDVLAWFRAQGYMK